MSNRGEPSWHKTVAVISGLCTILATAIALVAYFWPQPLQPEPLVRPITGEERPTDTLALGVPAQSAGPVRSDSRDVVKHQLQFAMALVAEALETPDIDDDILSEMELLATAEKSREVLGLTQKQLDELYDNENLIPWLREEGWVQ